ncbi:sensor protein LytS [Periweissella cryptocerci]|uniref:Sensor protein LytS n=1 Tax=Periweissella cryptocerci TaxID=2506420 RepID=A0A4V1AIQ5_9LACO|nr:LytS/YhcK type 5TM receptor domain-containing protein [Periweissella cryptocerci]QBO36325.1 sensor protein LytS [Periweissella cryptocerci]
MGSLFFLLAERIGLLLMVAFLLINVKYFRKLLVARSTWRSKLVLILVFSSFVILSNLTGIRIDSSGNIAEYTGGLVFATNDSMANTRTLGISVAGLVGGPLVGAVVGIIGGIGRFIQGHSVDWFYIVSSGIIGCVSGLVGQRNAKVNRYPKLVTAMLVGASVEIIQLVFVYFFASDGHDIIRYIALPMIFWNSAGSVMFISIITTYLNREVQLRAWQTQDVLTLMKATLPVLRTGLSQETATEVSELILAHSKFVGVEVFNQTERLVARGEISHDSKHAISGKLNVENQLVGSMKFYGENEISDIQAELVPGMMSIFSTQLAVGKVEQQNQLLKDEEIKALQAQINPHFFFNAINTILAVMRQDVDQARNLLLELSTYFRTNLTSTRATKVTLSQELEYLNAYLALEMTRFPNRYQIHYELESQDDVLLPPFTLQILVDNALKHAFGGRKTGNEVWINVHQTQKQLLLSVSDNGEGIDPVLLSKLGQVAVTSAHGGSGTALENLNRRLVGLYSTNAEIQVESDHMGTEVTIILPLEIAGNDENAMTKG